MYMHKTRITVKEHSLETSDVTTFTLSEMTARSALTCIIDS